VVLTLKSWSLPAEARAQGLRLVARPVSRGGLSSEACASEAPNDRTLPLALEVNAGTTGLKVDGEGGVHAKESKTRLQPPPL
jgi:hypothetical protein